MGPPVEQQKRAYRSQLRRERAAQTRQRVLVAARDSFLARGYAATTMQSVARAAGVSVATVEQAFGTKAWLLKAAIDIAIAGDDRPVPVLDREWTRIARNATTADELARVVTEVLAAAQDRSAGLIVSVFEGSTTDDDLADLADQLVAQREITAGWIVDRLTAHGDLRRGLGRAAAVETVWLLMDPALFLRLTRYRRWSLQRYQDWTATTIVTLLFPDPQAAVPTADPAPDITNTPTGAATNPVTTVDATNGDDPR
jgi:AcrR family transcriptional regulator